MPASAAWNHRLLSGAAETDGQRFGPVSWNPLFDLVTQLASQLRRQFAQQLQIHGLTESHFALLWACAQADDAGLPQGEVARAIDLSPAQTSVILEHARQLSWVEGYRPPSDRRRQLWRLTNLGRSQLHQALEGLKPWAALWDEAVATDQRLNLEWGLRAWSCVLSSADGHGSAWQSLRDDVKLANLDDDLARCGTKPADGIAFDSEDAASIRRPQSAGGAA